MAGKILSILLVVCGVAAGGAMYYLQVYGFYQTVDVRPGQDVVLLPLGSDVDADSSPIRYRACFETTLRPDALAQLFTLSEAVDPRNAPGWFDCFDAPALGAALKAGSATAFMGQKNIEFGVDRIVAITDDGRGFVWHELNNCGKKAYDGTVVGEACPERPETN